MAPTISSANGALILEEPLIRTPYELLRRSHRSAQRQVEKDFNAVQAALQGILKSLNGSESEKTEEGKAAIINKLEQASERAKGLKRKLDDLQPNEKSPTPLRSRLTYLAQTSPDTNKTNATPAINKKKISPVLTPTPTAKQDTTATSTPTKPGTTIVADSAGVDGAKGAEGISAAIAGAMDVDDKDEIEEVPPAPEPASHAILDRNLDRYVVDYLLRTGRKRAAQALADAQDIDPLVDIKLFAELSKIENALVQKHSCTEALAWCGENRGTLKKTQNNLEFTLRLQEFIELCRKRDIPSAIAYSRKNLSTWAGTHISELQQGMTLLAFGEKTGVGLYRKLYDQDRWTAVRDQFRETFLNLYAQPSQSILSLALSAGLSSLRLPSCVPHSRAGVSAEGEKISSSPVIPLLPAAPPIHNLDSLLYTPTSPSSSTNESRRDPAPARPSSPITTININKNKHTSNGNGTVNLQAQVGNVDCPTCESNMKILASEVPMSHHVNSTLVCRLSGKVMDSENPPLAFPNGYVYSSQALAEMAKNNFDIVTCPRTKETCSFSRLRKVYIS